MKFFIFTLETRLTAPQSEVRNLPYETRRAVAAADQGVVQLMVAVDHSFPV